MLEVHDEVVTELWLTTLAAVGFKVPRTPKEYNTLWALVAAGGRVVEKEDLIARVWRNSYVGDGSLARNISVLRKTLGEEVIETLPRRGYPITLPLALVPIDQGPSVLKLAPLEELASPVRRISWLSSNPRRLRSGDSWWDRRC